MHRDGEFPEDVLARLETCEEKIVYRFRDANLLHSALTHASGAQHRLASNERLEFLGDAILGAVVCDLLFRQFPHMLEGQLTKIKSVVVSRQTCAKISRSLGLSSVLIVGKGMATGRAVPRSLLADVFESLVAAVYLDGGYDAAREFIQRLVQPEIDRVATGETDDNYKSLLQQVVQRDFGATPTYQLLEEKGPDHNKCFRVAAFVEDREFPPAWGRNKKEAEQRAAGNALARLNGEPPPFPEDPPS
jgi:ribonuclease-3